MQLFWTILRYLEIWIVLIQVSANLLMSFSVFSSDSYRLSHFMIGMILETVIVVLCTLNTALFDTKKKSSLYVSCSRWFAFVQIKGVT